MAYKLIVAGGRDFNDYDLLERSIDKLSIKDLEIVSGNAYGADRLGEEYARRNGLNINNFPAQWGKYGKGAGHIRNKEMAEFSDGCICFWDGRSRGTKNMISQSRLKMLDLTIIIY